MKQRVIAVLIISIVGILIVYSLQKKAPEKILPIYNPVDVKSEMVDTSLLRKGFGHTIGKFKFQDQNGNWFSDADVKGKVFVVEYFFTTCGTICPKMNTQIQRVQKAYLHEKDVEILSFSVNPEVDTVEQMKRYAQAHGANDEMWHFLTGDKKELYALARTSFFVLKPAEAQNLGDAGSDFIHTNNFVLVDRLMRIRGYYDGTNPKDVNRLISEIQLVLKEGGN